jgi:hypothetical protein
MNRRRSNNKRHSYGKVMFNEILKNLKKKKEILGTIMFTDIVGSSNLWSKYGEKNMITSLNKQENVINKHVKKFKGIVVKTIGDAFMIFFKGEESYKNALECAYEIQYDLNTNKIIVGNNDFIAVRIGLCYGKLVERNVIFQGKKLKDYFGTTVNIASRMESKVSITTSPSFAFCIHGVDDPKLLEKVIDFVLNFDSSRKLTIELEDFKNDCETSSRSERLIKYTCDSVSKLKGVPELTAYLFILTL